MHIIYKNITMVMTTTSAMMMITILTLMNVSIVICYLGTRFTDWPRGTFASGFTLNENIEERN